MDEKPLKHKPNQKHTLNEVLKSLQDLIRFGRDLEKVVLSRAIRSHIRRKIIVHKGRTVVFD